MTDTVADVATLVEVVTDRAQTRAELRGLLHWGGPRLTAAVRVAIAEGLIGQHRGRLVATARLPRTEVRANFAEVSSLRPDEVDISGAGAELLAWVGFRLDRLDGPDGRKVENVGGPAYRQRLLIRTMSELVNQTRRTLPVVEDGPEGGLMLYSARDAVGSAVAELTVWLRALNAAYEDARRQQTS